MNGLADRTALVTGAGRGIGRGIARRLADEGVTVMVNDVDRDTADEAVSLIEDNGGAATPAVADVTDLDAVESLVADVQETHGPIEILVNNAG